ncbi:MAG: hypothetical protein KDK25_09415 [Leptospiraceae bacterium]|nr:hypothetical protein [Leptospiraceae bacterium]
MKQIPLFLLSLLLVMSPLALLADTVILKSGQEVDGQIVNQSETTISIRTRDGVQTLSKTQVRRILYGDAYRKQQDELKRKREEEKRRKEEEEKRKAEEEAKRLEEERQKAEKEAKRREEQERLEREEQKARDRARLEEERRQAREARNPWSIWIFAGPAGATLMPDAFRDNLATFRTFGSELILQPDAEEENAAVFGFGFSMPIWDMIFLEAEGRATGQTQNVLVLEGGRDTRPGGNTDTLIGYGTGDYGRMVRTTGDIRLGYRLKLSELVGLLNIGGESETSETMDNIELEPFAGYRFRQHDALYASTSFGETTLGPAQYYANENVSMFSRAKGPVWGIRILYRPLPEYPFKLEIGLEGYSLKADTSADLSRNVIYTNPAYREITSNLGYRSAIEGGAFSFGVRYGLTENIDLFTRLRGESARYSTEKLTVTSSDSTNVNAANSSVTVTLLSPIIAPLLNNEEESGSLEIGIIRRY